MRCVFAALNACIQVLLLANVAAQTLLLLDSARERLWCACLPLCSACRALDLAMKGCAVLLAVLVVTNECLAISQLLQPKES
jgi:hypothetical protein